MGLTYTFRNDDAGAPACEGTAGALVTLLDAILVNGYNTKTVTITRSSTTATANCTSHGYRTGQIILHSGADQADYNIEARVSVTDANNYTFAVAGSPATPATGTISAKVAPLGWTQAYTGTNKAAYRTKTGTNQFYLRVDDSDAQNSLLRGYEAMTAVDTGTNLFPTTAQIALASGLYLYKSNAASGTDRPWRAWSDGKMLHFIVQPAVTTWGVNAGAAFHFGDFDSFLAGDAYNTLLFGSTSASSSGSSHACSNIAASFNAATTGLYVARAYTGTAGAINASRFIDQSASAASSAFGSGNVVYPDPIRGGISISRCWIGEPSVAVRGRVRGLWASNHPATFAPTWGDTLSGADGSDLAGINFEFAGLYSFYAWLLEISDNWA